MSSIPTLTKLLNYIAELIKSLDELIETIRGNMRLSMGWTAFLFLLGFAATVVFYSAGRFQNMPDLLRIGPALLTSSVSAFQIKTIMVSRERIISYKSLRSRLLTCNEWPEPQIDALIAETVKALEELRKRD